LAILIRKLIAWAARQRMGRRCWPFAVVSATAVEFKELNPGRAGKAFPTIMFAKTIQESL
jgi:hypothetical protein